MTQRHEPGDMTADGVLAYLDEAVGTSAVISALELGLLWKLDGASDGTATARIADALAIPAGRCRRWLEVLEALGFVERRAAGWAVTAAARSAIVDTYSRATWSMLAQEARERSEATANLAAALRAGAGRALPSYVTQMARDPDRARRFCRMLFELHGPLAASVAAALDLDGVRRILDLGGGSGVLSLALAHRAPDVRTIIADVPTVCDAARELVAESGADPAAIDRIEFHPGDFMAEPLPSGIDLTIECDVGVYDVGLFARVRDALEPGGRFVIVDDFDRPTGRAGLAWALVRSLRDPDFSEPTLEGTLALLREAGFGVTSSRPLPALPNVGGQASASIVVIEARVG